MRPIGWSLAVWLGAAGGLAAQDATVRSFLDRTVVGVGQRFVLSVEISGNVQNGADPAVPNLSSFARFLQSGSSRQISMVNGRTTVSTTLQYTYLATAEGRFQIPSVAVDMGGTTRRTDPITIEIGPAPVGGAPGNPTAPDPNGIAPNDLFIRATASPARVYPNQPVVVEYRIYTRVNVRQYEVEPPSTGGFFVEEYPLPSAPVAESEIIDGQRYVVATIKKMVVFPTSVGDKTIDPVRVTAGIEVRNRSRDPFDEFFSLGSMLGRVVEHDVLSNPIRIEVVPLPDPAPEAFTGLVGQLTLGASIDSTTVERDNALTYRIQIHGNGNLKTVPAPTVEFPADFEVYPPEVSETGDWEGDRVTGRRGYDYVVIPRSPGTKVIPSVAMSFFDDQLNTYRTVRTPPIEITVTGDPVEGPVVSAGSRREVRARRDDIRFIRTEVPAFVPRDRTVVGSRVFWVVLLVPLAALGGAVTVRKQRDRLEGDHAYARRRRSSRRASRRLAHARERMSEDGAAGFFAAAEKALRGFLGDRLNVSEAGFIRDEVIEQLRRAAVDADVIEEYFACIDACAARRFAPGDATRDEMNSLLERAEAVMSDLERQTA